MSKVITKFFNKKIAEAVQKEFSSNVYYFALSGHSEWADELNPDTAYNTTDAINGFHREMILGKRIKTADVSQLVKRHFWTSNTIYAQYDDIDTTLYDKEFFIVNGSEQVYKCLFNNNDAPSTVEPSTVSTNKFSTADGYIWKYMYTISTSNNTKFSTGTYIPVDVNTSVTAAASNGSIDIVLISTQGSNYRGYTTGSIAQILSNTLFRVESTNDLSSENFFYNSSAFYITDGTGEGQLTTVSSYTVNSSGYYVTTTDQLNSPALDLTSNFRIAPQIKIQGDGTGAKAVCTVNTISNSYFIETVDVIAPGQNYSTANVTVVSNPLYGSGATLRAIIPPKGGHGADPATELGCTDLGVSLFFNNSEFGTISTDVPFRQASVVSIPYKFTAPTASFTFNALTAVSNTNDTITITNANTHFKVGDVITYETSTGNVAIGGLANNDTYYVIESNTTTLKLSTTYEGSAINLTSGISETGHRLYTTNRYYSNTFNALTYLNIASASGTILRNEYVVGATSGARAKVAFANSTIVKISYPVGTFSNSEVITGEDSLSTATISSINNPDIQPFTSSILYINNIEAITRSETEFEQVYMILTV